MSPVDLVSAWLTGLLAFVFLLSGLSKLGRTNHTLRAMEGFGLPESLRRASVARGLPVAELVLAAGLLLLDGWMLSVFVVAALVMLLIFTALIWHVLRRGAEVDCGCFGAFSHDGILTQGTLFRNLLLLGVAVVVLVYSASRADSVVHFLASEASQTLVLLLGWSVVAIVILLFQLVRARRLLSGDQSASEGIARSPADSLNSADILGSPIPDTELVSADGVTLPLSGLGRGHPVLLIFLSAECSSCARVAEQVPDWQASLPGLRVRIATSSRPDAIAEKFPEAVAYARYGARAAREAFGITGSPAAVALGGIQQPVVASPVVYGFEDIEALVTALAAA